MTRLLSPVLADFGDSVAFHCPACDYAHVLPVQGSSRPHWGYNQNPGAPHFGHGRRHARSRASYIRPFGSGAQSSGGAAPAAIAAFCSTI